MILSDTLLVSLSRDDGSDCVRVCDSDRMLFDCVLDASIGAEDPVGVENMYIPLVVLLKLVEPNVLVLANTDDRPVEREEKEKKKLDFFIVIP